MSSSSSYSITKKNIFITGGASGIGLHFIKLIANSKILKVLESELSSVYKDSKIIVSYCDVSNLKLLTEKFKEAILLLGSIDIVINNAGIPDFDFFNPLSKSEAVSNVINVDLTAVTEGTRLACIHMLEKKKPGIILNIASMGGLLAMPFAPVYCAAKFGVVGLSKSLYDNEMLKKNGIRVHAICPSFVDTKLLQVGVKESAGMKFAVNSQNGLLATETIAQSMLKCIENDHGAVMRITLQKIDFLKSKF